MFILGSLDARGGLPVSVNWTFRQVLRQRRYGRK